MLKKIILITLVFFIVSGFHVPKKVMQKAEKTIGKYFDSEKITLVPIPVSAEQNQLTPSEFDNTNFFKILDGGAHVGYGYIGNAPSKTATFDYLVLFDTNFIVAKSNVLVYREEYGGEIGSRRWLRQFDGTSSKTSELIYQKDIIPISGATISVQSMTKAMNNLLKSLGTLKDLKAI